MAEQAALFLELANTYHAKELGVTYRDLLTEGVIGTGLGVVQRAAGANMSVDVAAGVVWVSGDDDPNRQPLYRCRNDAVVNLAIAAADATKPRVDRIIAHVYDAQFAGAQNKWALEVLAGVATAGATDANLLGAAAIANNEVELARVIVPAAAASIVNANIVDHRATARVGSAAQYLTVSQFALLTPVDGQEVFLIADAANGVIWHFRYNAGSASIYKWEAVGAQTPLFSEVTAQETRTNNAYGVLTTAGPSVAVPRAGDYDVTIGAMLGQDGGSSSAYMSYDIGGTGAVDADGAFMQTVPGSIYQTGSRPRRKTALTSVTLTAKYRTVGVGQAEYANRFMAVAPVRVRHDA